MSRQSRHSQAPFRDTTDESARPRYSTSPHPLRGRHVDAPSTEEDAQASFPYNVSLSSRQTQGLPHLPPITSITSRLARSHGGIDTDRVTLPSLREAIPVRPRSDPPTTTTGTDYNARHYQDSARLYPQEGLQDIRGTTSLASRLDDPEPPQMYRLPPLRGGDVSNIARPSSAHDSAYLSDLSTSSALGGPPPSHTSGESTASASSEMSSRRVKSWRRSRHQSPDEEQQDIGTGPGFLRDEREFEIEVEASGEGGRYAPSYADIEYERGHGRRAQYPISTMRGGSTSSRGHPSYAYGSPSTTMPVSHLDLPRVSGNPYPESLSLGPGPVPGPAQVPDPIPSQRSLAAKKGKAKAEVPVPTRTAATAATAEGSAAAEMDELQESSDDEGPLHFAAASSTPSRTGSGGGTRTPRTKIEVACDFCRKRKMKCDGLRPTCKNCERKGVQCSYIPVVRRRGPGKKKKAAYSRPRKSNKNTGTERDVKQSKGKARETSSDVGALELDTAEMSQEASSSSGLRLEHHPHQHPQFPPPPTGMFSDEPGGADLYLPPPFFPQIESSPRGQSSRPSLSPFPTHSLLPLETPYNPHEQFPPPPPPPLGHRPSPPFGVGGGNLFLPPGHSPPMGAGREMRDIVDPYAGVNVNVHIPPPPADSAGGSTMSSDVPPTPWPVTSHHHHHHHQPSPHYPPIHGSARTTSMISSSSEGEPSRSMHARRRRPSKRSRTDLDDDEEYEDEGVYGHEEEHLRVPSGGRELEEGEIDEAGPSRRAGR